MTVRLAFCGSGYIAQIHAQAVQKLDDVEIVAVIDPYEEPREKFGQSFNIPRRYEQIDDLLRDGDIDAISINTPNAFHGPLAITALNAGIHVMVEKPMAMTVAGAQEMQQASEKSGALLMVAHCWRFDEEVLWLKQKIDSGVLGTPVRTKSYGVHSNWGPSGWFADSKLAGGGALADMGIHAIDTTRFLLGDPQPISVYAQIGTHYGDYDVDDTGIIIIQWDNGVTSYVEFGWWQPHMDGPEAATQIYGTKGFGQSFPTLARVPNLEKETVEEIASGFPAARDPHCAQSMYDTQMNYFIECIRTGNTPNPGAEEGIMNMRIVEAAYESSKLGQITHL